MRSTCTVINEKQHFWRRDSSHGLIRNSAIGVSKHTRIHARTHAHIHRHFRDGVSSHGPESSGTELTRPSPDPDELAGVPELTRQTTGFRHLRDLFHVPL